MVEVSTSSERKTRNPTCLSVREINNFSVRILVATSISFEVVSHTSRIMNGLRRSLSDTNGSSTLPVRFVIELITLVIVNEGSSNTGSTPETDNMFSGLTKFLIHGNLL